MFSSHFEHAGNCNKLDNVDIARRSSHPIVSVLSSYPHICVAFFLYNNTLLLYREYSKITTFSTTNVGIPIFNRMLRVASFFLLLAVSEIIAEDCADKGAQCSTSSEIDQDTNWQSATSVYDFHANDILGQNVSLDKYRGHVLIIVNVASNCGLTDTNYKQLQQLYDKYSEKEGLRILAFPSNQFAGQEPGSSAEILNFVKQYNVTFDMFEKIDVNGENAHPLWKWLKTQKDGLITNNIKWNFTKFIVNKEGKVVERFAPTTEPLSMEETLKKYF